MPRSPRALSNLRNGLKWRNGRPRWEPSPASRAAGIPGRDLKDFSGDWITDRGRLVSLCDARSDWAAIYRDAVSDRPKAREALEDLAKTLDQLPTPLTDEGRLQRDFIADIIEKCRAAIGNRPEVEYRPKSAGRTVAALVAAYFNDPPREISAGTLDAYRPQGPKLIAKFGTYRVDEVTRGMLYDWYHQLQETYSLSNANLTMGATAAFFRWATRHDGWLISQSPATDLGIVRAKGRLVVWPFDVEQAFVRWCDAKGFPDVADAVTMGIWTAARQVDMCPLNLSDLPGENWRYLPQKTKKSGIECLPAIMKPLRARIEGRRDRTRDDGIDYINPGHAPFLFDPENLIRHTSKSIGYRFAKAAGLAARDSTHSDHILLKAMSGLRLQDTRDTAVTRLAAAGVPIDRICSWTGHSRASAEKILREHYLTLEAKATLKDAEQLAQYARSNGIDL